MSTATLNEPEADEAEETTRVKRDPELLAIERIVRILADLDEDACARAIRYLGARYARKLDPNTES